MTHADDHTPPGPARTRWGLASVVMAVALLAVACTGNGGGPRGSPARPSDSTATTAAPSTAASARPGPIRLRGRLAFASDRGHNVELYLLELPSGRLRRLTTSPGADLSPAWAPDGTRLAYRSDRDGNDEVYAMDADGSRQRNLTRNPGSDYSPAWSPDGRQIAFASGRADPTGNDVWLMDADGTHPRPLVHQHGIDEYPRWSPDGSRLVFGCTLGRILPSRVGDFELCVVGADGRGLRRLTDAPGISAAGGWSADGRRIVFTSSRDQDPTGVSPCGDLFLVDADGAHLTKLTDGPTRYCDPSFTPDSRHLLVSSDRAHPGGHSDLYVMNPDGTSVTRLTYASSEEQEPTFTPAEAGAHDPDYGPARSAIQAPHQRPGLLWADLGLVFALAWVPVAALYHNPRRPALPAPTDGPFLLQTLGAAARPWRRPGAAGPAANATSSAGSPAAVSLTRRRLVADSRAAGPAITLLFTYHPSPGTGGSHQPRYWKPSPDANAESFNTRTASAPQEGVAEG